MTGLEIAVIGMSGRFPGAGNIEEFWDNIRDGVESIYFLTREELDNIGIDLRENPNYVNSKGGVLEDIESFDASFFGYTPREATIMNPQLKLFHECSWEALENAGYDTDSYEGLIGLFVGAASSFFWEGLCLLSQQTMEMGQMAARFLTDKDHLSTKIAYKLNLKGVSLIVNTACSTSLVAIHQGCRSLLAGDCDIVLAGGVGIRFDSQSGYIYQDGMINSPDGHCRAFDVKARGTVGGDGVGIVVLKPLEDAVADRDCIHAVIKGSAVNNDGARKVGYTAPSVDGQAEVIQAAHRLAEVEPASISYVETHGTATELGDPIEIAALKMAFNGAAENFCAIGSVKTNIGHLDHAAGVAGFLKVVMALKNRLIPPSLHFETPNPKIDFKNSPFYVSTKATAWSNGSYPLRAGVSSFGIGGTNVHLILEEVPPQIKGRQSGSSREQQLILLSAKTSPALDKLTENLAAYLKSHPEENLADAAYTLKIGRKAFAYRRMTVCSGIDEAVRYLSDPGARTVYTSLAREEKRTVIFMFSGLGAQYVGMGRELYQEEPVFREELDRCFELLSSLTDLDIKQALFPDGNPDKAGKAIELFEAAQLVVFISGYALARLLMKWGITPQAMIGYSFGEYTAACISGVISLEDALKLIVHRGRLIQGMPEGAMLSVPLTREELEPLMPDGLSIAIDNGPSCVVSGSTEQITLFESRMREKKYICVPLKANRAIHSKMMEPVSGEFENIIEHVSLKKPEIPHISNLTGTWLKDEEALVPGYWARHLKTTVLFAEGIREILKMPNPIFIEVGPGHDLGALVRHHIENEADQLILNTVKHPQEKISDSRFLLNRVGRLWLSGIKIDWREFYAEEQRYRIPLPTYPFERKVYRFEREQIRSGAELLANRSVVTKKPNIPDWFYVPSWKRSVAADPVSPGPSPGNRWIIFEDCCGLGARLAQHLRGNENHVVCVKPGAQFHSDGEGVYTVNPQKSGDYDALFRELQAQGEIPDKIVHLWSVSEEGGLNKDIKAVDQAQDLGFYSLLYLAQVIGGRNFENRFRITVISNNVWRVTGEEELCPEKATLVGAVKVIPQEYENIECASIDIVLNKTNGSGDECLIDKLSQALSVNSPEKIVAYRGDYRWVPTFEPVPLAKDAHNKSRLREKGVYLITGGLGGMGLEIAKELVNSVRARLILTGRSALPPREEWDDLLSTPNEDDVSMKIRKVKELEESGAEVMICRADAASLADMQTVAASAKQRFGQINGVIHAAGLADGCVISRRTREETDGILSPKVTGTLILDHILQDMHPDFIVLCSSISSITAQFGQVGYCAANAFLDAYAQQKNSHGRTFAVSINWDNWKEVGMGVENVKRLSQDENIKGADLLLRNGMTNSEAIEVFKRTLDNNFPQIVVSTSDLMFRIQQLENVKMSQATQEFEVETYSGKLFPRPELSTEYVPPKTDFEKTFANILKKFFGYEQVGIYDNLFEFGLTSLTIIRVNNILKKELNRDIPIVAMFEYPTIASLGKYLEHEETGETLSDEAVFQLEGLEETEDLLHSSIDLLRNEAGQE
jgi:acyl transferase domain-containing protein